MDSASLYTHSQALWSKKGLVLLQVLFANEGGRYWHCNVAGHIRDSEQMGPNHNTFDSARAVLERWISIKGVPFIAGHVRRFSLSATLVEA